jgi:hypothetical protein
VSSGPGVLPWEWTQAGDQPAPFDYEVPPGQEVQPYTATATYDGTGASGDFVPTISIYSQSGNLLARVFPPVTVTMGDVAEVTFLPPFGSAATSSSSGGITEIDSSTLEVTNGTGPTTEIEIPPYAVESLSTGPVSVAASTSQLASFSHTGGSTLMDLTTPTAPAFLATGVYAVWLQMEVFSPGVTSAYGFLEAGTTTGSPTQFITNKNLPYAAAQFNASGGAVVSGEGTIKVGAGTVLNVFMANGDPANAQSLQVKMEVKFLGLTN